MLSFEEKIEVDDKRKISRSPNLKNLIKNKNSNGFIPLLFFSVLVAVINHSPNLTFLSLFQFRLYNHRKNPGILNKKFRMPEQNTL